MTKLEAIQKLVSQFRVRGKVIDYDYDPAGSSITYAPEPKDMEVLEALVDRPVTEDDLWFQCGGYSKDHYVARDVLIKDIKA